MSITLWLCFGINIILYAEATLIDSDILNNEINANIKFEPTWESLDSRPLPSWYDEAKVGVFIHWGVYAVPNFGTEWFWQNWRGINDSKYISFMEKNYKPGFTYQDFGRDFTAELFDPEEWAELFKASGARYVVLTSKHHEGYTLWPSSYSFSWNSVDVGAHRDLVGDLAAAIRSKTDLRFGLYHSLYEWFNRLYLDDKANEYKTQQFVDLKIIPEMHELVNTYKPEILWSDGEWEASDVYWRSLDFLSWLYNDSPVKETVVTNDRWGKHTLCKHGGFFTCIDRFNPGILVPHKWENAMTIDKKSWGFRRNAKLEDYLTSAELIKELVETVSCGGNILVNIGPTKEGMIDVVFEERLRDMGKWLSINGEAVYGSIPWTHQKDTKTSGVWYTQPGKSNGISKAGSVVYVFVLNWPEGDVLQIGAVRDQMDDDSNVAMLGFNRDLDWYLGDKDVNILFPNKSIIQNDLAWVLKITLN